MTSPNVSFQHWSTEAANFQIWQLRFPVAPRGELSTVLLTPKLFVLAGVHEFGADREIVASLNNSSNNQRLDAKLARYLLGFDVTLLVMEDGSARDHFDVRKRRQPVYDALCDSVAHIFG